MTPDERAEARQAEQMLREAEVRHLAHAKLNGLGDAVFADVRIAGGYNNVPPSTSVKSGAAGHGADLAQMTVADYERQHKHRQLKLGERASDLAHQREVLISYLRVKMHTEDWHGVMDVACDLREIDAERKGMTL